MFVGPLQLDYVNWPDDDIDKKNALYLAEGMELVHQQNEPIGLI